MHSLFTILHILKSTVCPRRFVYCYYLFIIIIFKKVIIIIICIDHGSPTCFVFYVRFKQQFEQYNICIMFLTQNI